MGEGGRTWWWGEVKKGAGRLSCPFFSRESQVILYTSTLHSRGVLRTRTNRGNGYEKERRKRPSFLHHMKYDFGLRYGFPSSEFTSSRTEVETRIRREVYLARYMKHTQKENRD